MPHTREEAKFEGEWTQTFSGERFLLTEDGDRDKIIIFSTTENLNLPFLWSTVVSHEKHMGVFRIQELKQQF